MHELIIVKSKFKNFHGKVSGYPDFTLPNGTNAQSVSSSTNTTTFVSGNTKIQFPFEACFTFSTLSNNKDALVGVIDTSNLNSTTISGNGYYFLTNFQTSKLEFHTVINSVDTLFATLNLNIGSA